jgi:DNA-binding SARP family transcriptional activator/predicted ATPase/uncharacterized protein HemY
VKLSLALLGPFRATLDQKPLPVSRTRKIEALLAYLAMTAGQPHPRTTLDGLLFPEMGDEAARTNLRQTLTRLRRAIHDARASSPFILLIPEMVQFNPASDYELDVRIFEEKLQGCARHRGKREECCAACMRQLQEAAALYRGPFLDEFYVRDCEAFETWMQTERGRLHQEAMEALQCVANYHERRGEYKSASSYTRRLLELDPWQEEAHRQLMRLLARQGQRSTALAQYERCRHVFAEELGLNPSPETETLCARIRATPGKRPHNLSSPGGQSFVGRERELGDIQQHLADPDRRLLVLLGPGGIGKTALALKAGWAIVEDYLGPFMDGVYFIPLMSEQAHKHISPASFVMAVIQALSLSLTGSELPRQQLLDALADRECLFIVDNGECLDGACRAEIAHVLHQTAAVKFLVTSRERLNLIQEWVLEIEGLPYPASPVQQRRPGRPPAFGPEIEAYEAIQLFVQRARQVDAGFLPGEMTPEEREGVVRISQLVQGMPLAIELAAPWARVLSCQQIAEEIGKNLDALACDSPALPVRHRCIRAVFEHSWRMLSPGEQHVLARLSIFPNSFGLEAAEQVAGATLPVLSSLRDKSLLQRCAQGTARYNMHLLLRQFSSGKIAQADQSQANARHAHYYGHLLAQMHAEVEGARMPDTLQKIQEDIENVRAGWHWAITHHEVDLLGQYMHTLYVFYVLRTWWHEGCDLFAQAVALVPSAVCCEDSQNRQRTFAGLLLRLAEFDYSLGDLDQAETLLRRSQALGHLVEDPEELALTYEKLGHLACRRGNYVHAAELLQFSLQVAQETDSKNLLAHILMSLGAVARDQEDYTQACEYLRQSLSAYQETEYQWGIANALRLLGDVTRRLGDHGQARHCYEESLGLCQALENSIMEALAWNGLGQIAQAEGEYAEAEGLYQRSKDLLHETDDDKGLALVFENLGNLMLDQGRFQNAQVYLHAGFKAASRIQDTPMILRILTSVARLVTKTVPLSQSERQAAELLSIVHQHPVCTPSLKEEAIQLLGEIMSPDTLPSASSRTWSFNEVESLVHNILVPR